jgi:glutamate synthase domain-containing protein 3
VAFVFDAAGSFATRCNRALVELEPQVDLEYLDQVKNLVTRHLHYTGSQCASRILLDWSEAVRFFVKVMPRDYKRVLTAQRQAAAEGRTPDFSELVGA